MEMTIMPKRSIAIIRPFFVAFIIVFFTVNLTAAPDWESANTNPTITLDVKNEPLRSVLGLIYKTTAWKIKAPNKWMDRPVTQTLNEVKLEDGLRFILKNAGIENLLLLYDENIMVITVFDTEAPQRQSANGPSAQVDPQPPVVSAVDTTDPILQRRVKDAGSGPSRGIGSRRSKRQASIEEEE